MLGHCVMHQNKLSFEVTNAVILQDYRFSVTVFHMLGPSLMDQSGFFFELLYAMIARILFSACWNIV